MPGDVSPHVLVVGAGGMGSLFGGLLAERGLPVTLLSTRRELADAVATAGGLKIVGHGGERLVPLNATADPTTVKSADIVIFLCKAGANREAALSVRHVFGPNSVAVSFQNGLGNEEAIEAVVGPGRVLAGLTSQGARLEAPGVVRNFTELPTYLGERPSGLSDRTSALAALFSAHGLPTTASPHIMHEKWAKLFANIAFSAPSGATGLTIGEIGSYPPLQSTSLRAIDEAAAVANAEGISFDGAERRAIYDELIQAPGPSSNTPSMYRDLQARKKSEVDFIYGTVIERAAKHSIPVPTLETLRSIIKGIELANDRP